MTDVVAAAPAPVVTAPVAAPIAPVAAPVADPGILIGEAPKPANSITTDTDTDGAVTYADTGDAGLNMALGFVGKLGLGPDDAAIKAAGTGDFSMLKAKLAGLGDKAKGWEQYVALAEKSHADTVKATDAKVQKDTEVIHGAVGGKEQWAAISTWAAANAEPEEKAAVNSALKQGGLVAKVMALWLAERHSKANGTVKEPAPAVAAGAAGKADNSGAGPLSAKEYAKEVQALRQKEGYGFENGQGYKALQARRTAGQRTGK